MKLFERKPKDDSRDKDDKKVIPVFIKRRSYFVPLLKSFRKSMNTRYSWNRGKSKFLWAMKKFHTSLQGQKLHRKMGRFLSLRDSQEKSALNLNRDDRKLLREWCIQEIKQAHSIKEQIELELLLEDINLTKD